MPRLIGFRIDGVLESKRRYIFSKLGVQGKSMSERWRKLLVNMHNYLVKADSEKVNNSLVITKDTRKDKRPLAIT